MNDLYPLTFIILATILFLQFAKTKKEKEERKRGGKGRYICMGGCWTWEGPLPPRPQTPPPASNPRKGGKKLTKEIKCPTCGSNKISRMDAYTEVDEIDATTDRMIRRAISSRLIFSYAKCQSCGWTDKIKYL